MKKSSICFSSLKIQIAGLAAIAGLSCTFPLKTTAAEGYILYEDGVINYSDIQKNNRYKPYKGKNYRNLSRTRLNSKYSYTDFRQRIYQYSKKYEIEPSLIRAIIETESAFNPYALSPKGAIGLMQLMPNTAKSLGVDPWNPAENIMGGVKHLKFLEEQYNGNLSLMLAAYNAGEKNVDKYGGIPPFKETMDYVHKVKRLHRKYKKEMAAAERYRKRLMALNKRQVKIKKPVVKEISLTDNARIQNIYSTDVSLIEKNILGDTVELTNIYKR
ncbi:MAG: lytic transglycosylase domain-containing protein [Nitrospinae bacterium]|nr:lytic transglycosylase domain-containing protein [Nitrospinota bacterium]